MFAHQEDLKKFAKTIKYNYKRKEKTQKLLCSYLKKTSL